MRYELLCSILEGNLLSVLSLLYDRIDFALTRSADVFLAKMPGIAPPCTDDDSIRSASTKLDNGCQVCFNAAPLLTVTAASLFMKLHVSSQPRCEKGFMEGEADRRLPG